MAFKSSATKQPAVARKSQGSAKQGSGWFKIPFISGKPITRQLQILGGALLAFLFLTGAAAYFDNRAVLHGTHYVAESSKLLMLSQRMAKAAERSLSGDYLAFEELARSREEAAAILALLAKGDGSLPATSGKPRAVLDELTAYANKTLADTVAIEDGRPGLVAVSRSIAAIDASAPELRVLTEQLVANSSGAQRDRAVRFSLLVERIAKDTSAMLGDATAEQVGALGLVTLAADEALATFPQGDPLIASITNLFDSYRVSAEAIIGNAQNLLHAKRSGKAVFTDSENMLNQAQKLTDAYQDTLSMRISSMVMALSGAMAALLLLLLLKVILGDTKQRARDAELANSRNQAAILRLMNEMGDLADGDLTITATVTEDITGAIADSVNYTTGELRKLVSGITAVTGQINRATSEAETISKNLLEAAQKQSGEIRDAGDAVGLISKSIQEVDASAAQSLQVAQRTLEVTEEGAQAVQNTIAGMDEIRGQIQETSKRIKRLGERSQEIGEIVDLISDITEQTNVLALNAAMQAASAGEAGRGFSVVAAEVQRLAERSAEATKQISRLVKTIQGDTQEAVAAMEKSTHGVVAGTNLSNLAGQSLREIEQVSRELAALIGSISVSTQMQTEMARDVAATMVGILHITEQTTQGTQRTSASVAELANLATGLNSSIAGFKL